MNILVIAAHPDDEVLGCGGTIARLTSEGDAVFVGILGEGATSRFVMKEVVSNIEVEELQKSGRKAARILGVQEIDFASFPDNRFDTVPLINVVKRLEAWIQRWNPEVIYTQNGGDLNIDHVVTHRAVLTAARPLENGCVKRVYAYEVPSSTEWSFGTLGSAFCANVFVDISSSIGKKMEALRCYKKELRPFPHPRSLELIRALAMNRGATSGVKAAEAFMLIREIK